MSELCRFYLISQDEFTFIVRAPHAARALEMACADRDEDLDSEGSFRIDQMGDAEDFVGSLTPLHSNSPVMVKAVYLETQDGEHRSVKREQLEIRRIHATPDGNLEIEVRAP